MSSKGRLGGLMRDYNRQQRPARRTRSTALSYTSVPATPVGISYRSPEAWQSGADYIVVLYTHFGWDWQPALDRGTPIARYQLWTKNGKGYRGQLPPIGRRSRAEAEYITLIRALEDLLGRIERCGADPSRYTVTIYSRREEVAKALEGIRPPRGSVLRPLFDRAQALLWRFGPTATVWQASDTIEELLAE